MKQIFSFLAFSLLIISCSKNTLLSFPIVSLPNQNFVYKGVNNELQIEVPGAKSFKVTAPGLTEYASGKYSWRVDETNSTTAVLDFEIITKKDSVFHTKKEFYVQKAPNLIATLNDRGCDKCIIELVKDDLKETKISVRPDNYNDLRFRNNFVKEYTLVLPEGYEYRIYQDKFSDSAQKMIAQYPTGTIFKIKDIVYRFCGYPPPAPELKFILVDQY